MKKVVLTAILASFIAFTSCKENTKKEIDKDVTEISNNVKGGLNDAGNSIKEGYNDAKESIKSTFNDIRIPELNDEKAEAHLKSYAAYVKMQMNKGAKNIKNAEFVKETQEFANESEMYMKNLSAEAKASFKATMQKIDAKVDEIEKDLED